MIPLVNTLASQVREAADNAVVNEHARLLVNDDPVVATCAEVAGRCVLITGCMFSGKTTALLRTARLFAEPARVLVKHAGDTRYRVDAIVAHDGDHLPAHAIADARAITELTDERTHLVVVDEVHFFDDSLADVLAALTRCGIGVVAAGLDLGCWGQPFPSIERLVGQSDEHRELTGRCARCGQGADRTQRTTPIMDGCLVGGAESYEPRCIKCWTPPPES